MSPTTFSWKSTLPFSAKQVFDWHTRAGAFERLNPPWRPVRILHKAPSIQSGSEVRIALPLVGPLALPWHLRHTDYSDGVEFSDEQVSGPFRSWRHRHRFIAESTASMTMLDEVTYNLPWYGKLAAPLVTRELSRLFAFRHAQLAADLELHARWSHEPRKNILIAGSSGFIGSALAAFLSTAGHTVYRLVRRASQGALERSWNPGRGELNPAVFDGIDVVINLAGESILGRWTSEKKRRIRESRVTSTALIARTISQLDHPPSVAIMASAIGIYGDTGDRAVTEGAEIGKTFLAEVTAAWEAAAEPLTHTSCRLVQLRIGTVLNAAGGALQNMLPAFMLGVGGRLGHGEQYMSWIALHDLLGIFEHAIFTPSLSGPVNVVAPTPCTNANFTSTLGDVLHRPTVFAIPSVVLRSLCGELADDVLLASARVEPKVLQESAYGFLFPELAAALRIGCGR